MGRGSPGEKRMGDKSVSNIPAYHSLFSALPVPIHSPVPRSGKGRRSSRGSSWHMTQHGTVQGEQWHLTYCLRLWEMIRGAWLTDQVLFTHPNVMRSRELNAGIPALSVDTVGFSHLTVTFLHLTKIGLDTPVPVSLAWLLASTVDVS